MPARDRAFVLCLFLLVCPMLMNGQNSCGIQQIQGTYVGNGIGYANYYPFSALGTFEARADGTATLSEVAMTPLGKVDTTIDGTWAPEANCRFTVTFPLSPAPIVYKGVLVRNGQQMDLMQSSPAKAVPAPGFPDNALTATLRLTRVTPGADTVPRCIATEIKGTYSKSCTGWRPVAAVPEPFWPITFSGTVVMPGDGTFTGSGLSVFNGETNEVEYQNGTVKVNSDCSGTVQYQIAPSAATWTEALRVLENGKHIIAITVSSFPYTPSTAPMQVDVCDLYRVDQ